MKTEGAFPHTVAAKPALCASRQKDRVADVSLREKGRSAGGLFRAGTISRTDFVEPPVWRATSNHPSRQTLSSR
jgi:hypothetical protein